MNVSLCFVWWYEHIFISLQQKTNNKQINTLDYENRSLYF